MALCSCLPSFVSFPTDVPQKSVGPATSRFCLKTIYIYIKKEREREREGAASHQLPPPTCVSSTLPHAPGLESRRSPERLLQAPEMGLDISKSNMAFEFHSGCSNQIPPVWIVTRVATRGSQSRVGVFSTKGTRLSREFSVHGIVFGVLRLDHSAGGVDPEQSKSQCPPFHAGLL